MKTMIDIKDVNGDDVFYGDKFMAYMVRPSHEKGTIVTVVPYIHNEELNEVEEKYDVEDSEGNRLWNSYMVIRNGEKLKES